MISHSVARSGKCASNLSPKKPPKRGTLSEDFEETTFRGEPGRSRIAFGAGLSWTENPAL
jgi:hypothetical protein